MIARALIVITAVVVGAWIVEPSGEKPGPKLAYPRRRHWYERLAETSMGEG